MLDPTGPSVRRSFEELLLLSIIDAYPPAGKPVSGASARAQRERRLKEAMNALFGRVISLRGEQARETTEALRWMGAERYRDLGIRTLKEFNPDSERFKNHHERSDRALAREAEKLFFDNQEEAIIETLRKQFAKQERYWITIAQMHDDVHETIETQLLIKILELLEKGGVNTKLAQ